MSKPAKKKRRPRIKRNPLKEAARQSRRFFRNRPAYDHLLEERDRDWLMRVQFGERA